ncbi:MAG: tetratricopeptide repeat protein [Candidatus Heimdallarchaeota archaeon]
MELHQLWPKELQVHFWRLDKNIHDLILNYIQKNKQENLDVLSNFIHAINKMLTIDGIYMNNSEFLFLAVNVLLLQAKHQEIVQLCQKDEFHPGLLNVKAYSLIVKRKFNEIPILIKSARNYSKSSDPYNYLFSMAIELLYLYYAQYLELIEEKITTFTQEYTNMIQNNLEQPRLSTTFSEAFFLGKSVQISLARRKGRFEEGSSIGQDLISKARLTGNRYLLNRLLNNTALCLVESGNLKEGLEYLEEAFSFSQVVANEVQLASGANNIGFIFRTMGNLEMSMKYFYIALENAKKANVPPYIVASETNIAHLHLDFGNPSLALSDSDIALESLKKSEVPIPPQIEVSLGLCRADIFENLDRFQDASDTLDRALEVINENNILTEIPKVCLRQARLSARQSNLGEASKLLEKALATTLENNQFELIVNIKLQLAEIDLLRYRMTNEKILLQNALTKMEDSKTLCIEQDYKLVLIDIYILQGLLFTLNNQQKAGRKVLDQAKELACELNLKDKELEAENQLKELKQEKKGLLVRIFTRINESIRSTISFESVTRPKEVKSEMKAIYIISKNAGLPLFQKEFDETKRIDPNLLSGLISAISTMGTTVLDAEEEGLKLIDHGDVAIMLETVSRFFVAVVVTKETFLMREKLREFAMKIVSDELFQKDDESVIVKDANRDQAIEELIKEYFLENKE